GVRLGALGDAHEVGRRLAGVLGPRAGGLAHARLDCILSSAAPARCMGSVGRLRARSGRRGGRVASPAPSLPEVFVLHAPSREPSGSRVGLAPSRLGGVAAGGSREPEAASLPRARGARPGGPVRGGTSRCTCAWSIPICCSVALFDRSVIAPPLPKTSQNFPLDEHLDESRDLQRQPSTMRVTNPASLPRFRALGGRVGERGCYPSKLLWTSRF